MSEAFIGIGANLGNRVETLKRAVYNLSESVCLVGASRIYETEPIGFKDQPAYLNAVLKIETQMGARTLLNHLLALELEFGRIRKEKWGPRILDLDILLYGVEVIEEEGLHIPHPHLHLRSFVLAPLCDLAPDDHHPKLDKSYSELLESIGSSQAYTVVDSIFLTADTS